MRKHPLLLSTLVLWLVGSPAAASQDPQSLFDDGLRYMLDGQYKLGCALIARSLELDPRPGTIFTLAECYARAGKHKSAMEHYNQYLSRYAAMSEAEQEEQRERAQISEQELDRLDKQIARVRVLLPEHAPPGVKLRLNDEPFEPDRLGVSVAVDPGPLVFTSQAPGGPRIEQRETIQPGERRTIVLEVQPAPSPNLPPASWSDEPLEPEKDEAARGSRAPWIWVAAGVGAAGVITGSVFGLRVLEQKRIINEHCTGWGRDEETGATLCAPGSGDAVDAAQRRARQPGLISTVAFGVGGAGLGAALFLWLTDRSDGGEKTARGVTPSVTVTPQRAAVEISGAW